jgi:hypothetical protein
MRNKTRDWPSFNWIITKGTDLSEHLGHRSLGATRPK